MLEKGLFIEYPEEFDSCYKAEDPSPIFRYTFELKPGFKRASVTVCGLGIGYYYLNGEPITEDLFISPVSDYNKTLWTNEYDVTDKLYAGENLFAVIVGNGFYNESVDSIWKTNTASWRGLPKFALQMIVEYENESICIESNEQWICSKDSPIRCNQLRIGEKVDLRVNKDWYKPGFQTENWINARVSTDHVPKGEFRKCECQPIRADKEYRPVRIFKNSIGRWIIDFGQNISGFLRIRTQGPKGSSIKIHHSELINPDGTCNYTNMLDFYPGSEFQTDEIIFSGDIDEWHPFFTYYGFRYVEIEGMEEKPCFEDFSAVFVHQMVDEISTFECSDETINKLFSMGKISSFSNMFYNLTDCPTREKFGWLNDASASCEQMLQNFDIVPLMKKWLQDIYDSVSEEGRIPGVVPTHGWCYDSWTGPLCSDAIFELPYRIYRICGESEVLAEAFPYMLKHIRYVIGRKDPIDGLIGYGLSDWAGPFTSDNPTPTPLKFTDTLLAVKFCRIAQVAARISNDSIALEEMKDIETDLTKAFYRAYVDADGRCKICEQTAVSMMIVLGLYSDLLPLKEQLFHTIEKYEFHIHCGMLGMQYLLKALDICDLSEYAFRLITADGFPSYKHWIENGATTLWEVWDGSASCNHHMYSCILAWFNTTIAGLNLADEVNAYQKAVISPKFLAEIEYCKASYKTVSGLFSVNWQRDRNNEVKIEIVIPHGVGASLHLTNYEIEGLCDIPLTEGCNKFVCHKVKKEIIT